VLPLRTSLGGNPAFAEILDRVSSTTVGALTHQDYPFHRWIAELRRPTQGARLFSALFVVHEEAFVPAFDGLSAHWFSTEAFGTSLFSRSLPWYPDSVAFYANDTGSGWNVTILGDSNAFADTALEHMLEQWRALVQQVLADPSRRLGDLDLPPRAGSAPAARFATLALDRDEIDQLFA
jgi:non-ribosomal peptide synthetase component F